MDKQEMTEEFHKLVIEEAKLEERIKKTELEYARVLKMQKDKLLAARQRMYFLNQEIKKQ